MMLLVLLTVLVMLMVLLLLLAVLLLLAFVAAHRVCRGCRSRVVGRAAWREASAVHPQRRPPLPLPHGIHLRIPTACRL